MTDLAYDVGDDVEAIVEDSELPRRLKNSVYEAVEGREGATAEKADEIVRAVEHRYRETRVDPLDPVGTVSAQSIGEPGTQMSIPHDERVIVRRDDETDVVEIGSLIDGLLHVRESQAFDDHEVTRAPESLEVLSLRSDEGVTWKPVEEVSRHDAPDELLRFELESGRTIRATKAHSFVTRQENEVVPIAGEDLEKGDWIPVVSEFDGDDFDELDLREYLPGDEYWYTSTLTDGGVVSYPGGEDQIRNKRRELEAGELDEQAVYPRQGTVSLPERFPLDEGTGFFLGAFLAEGSVTDHYASVSNADPAFQDRIRAFADRFDLSTNEYENESGFATGYDIRLNGTILVDLLRATCYEDDQKIVPDFAFGATGEFVRGLLAGYFSGDGNVGKRSVRSSSTSERLTEGIALLLGRVGIYATRGEQDDSHTLRIPAKYVGQFHEEVGMVGERNDMLAELVEEIGADGPDATDQVPNFGGSLKETATAAGIPSREVHSAHERQRIGRNRLERLISEIEERTDDTPAALEELKRAVNGDVVWGRIESIETIEPDHDQVYDFSVAGLDTFTTAQGVVTHNTMNTFHYAGVAEIDVTQGLPRLIELVDARKTPDTPMMTVHLEGEYATERSKAHEVVWKIESTKILALGDISTNVADMRVQVDLNEQTLRERWPKVSADETDAQQLDRAIEGDNAEDGQRGIIEQIERAFGDEITDVVRTGTTISFGPAEPSYRDLLQIVERLRDIVFKGIEDITRVVIRKEEASEEYDRDEEFVLYTEGSAFGDVLDIQGVDASRTTCNNIHEIYSELGVEAARNAIINETMETLEEQGLDDVNIRHLMLVADIMTNRGTIESIGRHGISGSKESVLARAAFEVTVNHLLEAATHGEVDDLNGVTENVIVGKPIKLGTGDVDLRMGSFTRQGSESAD